MIDVSVNGDIGSNVYKQKFSVIGGLLNNSSCSTTGSCLA